MKSAISGAVIGLALAGLAQAADTSKPGAEVNACSLISDKEIGKAMGMAVDPGERKDSGMTRDNAYSSTCLWRVTADRGVNKPDQPLNGARFAILNVQSWPAGSGKARQFLSGFRAAGDEHIIANKPVDVKIGDEGLWWGSGVAVRKGDFSFGISVHLIDGKPLERGMEETLAKQIVARL
jgi:hypothetical protein